MGLLDSKIKELQDTAAFEGKKAIIQIIDEKDIEPGKICLFWDDDIDNIDEILIGRYKEYKKDTSYPHITDNGNTGYEYAVELPEEVVEKLKELLPTKLFV